MGRKPESTESDVHLDEVIAEFMLRVDRGENVDPEATIAAHPELAIELRNYFSQVGALNLMANIGTTDNARELTSRNALRVNCPNCHTSAELAVDTALTDLKCSGCGSQFSLVDQNKETWSAPALSNVGRFELIERIGVGGFGSVWKARDKDLERTVAIKIPRQGGMTTAEQEKFFREARAAAQLRHPNIVSVHEVGRDGDSIYIVSDFVRGVTLSDWLTSRSLTGRESAELCMKIAEALHHAHNQGVVHRDLKPANIMIDDDGQPHLMDFGLARREVGEETITTDGQVLGTPAYMSPEQALGASHQADCRSDVYSLGVILFQLLTGELPFRGHPGMLIHQVIYDEPPSPRKLNDNISKDLETITLKCLEKSPDRRYQTSKELSRDLQRVTRREPIQARPIGTAERLVRWYFRSSSIIATTAGGYAIILAILFTCWEIVGITLILTGLIPGSTRGALELFVMSSILYPLIFIVGIATVKGRFAGLIGGLILGYGSAVAILVAALGVRVGLLQLEVMSAALESTFVRYQICSLLFLLSAIACVLYTIAFVSRVRADRTEIRQA